MITIKDAVKVNVSLVVKLCDFVTGNAVSGLEVASEDGLCRPVVKPDGYYVFTNRRPKKLRVVSERYEPTVIETQSHRRTVLRVSLIPRGAKNVRKLADGEAHIGFGGGARYALSGSANGGASEIRLQKDDLLDVTDLYHALVSADGATEVLYLTKNLGDGRYALENPLTRDYPVRGTRLIPLYRVMNGNVPVPKDAGAVYTSSGGVLNVRNGEEFLWD